MRRRAWVGHSVGAHAPMVAGPDCGWLVHLYRKGCVYTLFVCEKVFGQTLSVTHDRIRFVWVLQVLKILVGQLNLEGLYIERLGHHSAFTKENWFLPIISLRLSSLVVPMMGAVTFFALQAKATWAIFTPFFSASSLTLEAESR